MPPMKQKAVSGAAKPSKKPRQARQPKPKKFRRMAENPSRFRSLHLCFKVRTIASRTRSKRAIVQEIIFTSDTSMVASQDLREMKMAIKQAVHKGGAKYNGEYMTKGLIRRGVNEVILEEPQDPIAMTSVSVDPEV